MKHNVLKMDRIARFIIAFALGGLYFQGIVTGTIGMVMLLVAIVILMTALTRFCPLYSLLGIKSSK